MEIKPIINKEQFEIYLQRIYDLIQKDLDHDLKLCEELEQLIIVVKEYDEIHYRLNDET